MHFRVVVPELTSRCVYIIRLCVKELEEASCMVLCVLMIFQDEEGGGLSEHIVDAGTDTKPEQSLSPAGKLATYHGTRY